ncbi:peptidase G2 autoproteolytic cleavage domain-containing protein [Neobacillus niacini]|uniref:peptidase G2 autoproteolytic cleavage domain-containing protein n=1 Tax=Neobacillus niacini TaxID=86668 RepID=UPI0007ABD0EA|nr:peptidase G2 autoproteolytic cleavage domain-containing protein [Neobacillus niacini]
MQKLSLKSHQNRPSGLLNPHWNPDLEYFPRLKRTEWMAVGLVGKLLVRDDGNCQVNGFCKPNDDGIATPAQNGYRVMKRTGPNQIQIFVFPYSG